MPETLPVLAELTRFGLALTGALRRDTVVETTHECLVRLFHPAAAVVALLDPGVAGPTIAAASGLPTPGAADEFLRDILAAQRVVRQVTPARLGVPLVAAGHAMGILAVWGRTDDGFGVDDEAVIAAVAAQAAISLQNARLVTLLSSGKQEWEQMVDAIGLGICIVDASGAVRRANRAFASLVGAPVTALTGRPWLTLLPPAWADAVGRALDTPGAGGGEIRADRRIFAVSAHPTRGEPGSAVLLIEDITENRRLQEQLIQSEKLSAIGQLIAGVAHELNNPLASVLGFADYLGEAAQLPESLVEPIRVIQQEAQRAATIVRNLLGFARRQDQDRRRLDVGPVLQRTVALLNNQLLGLKVEPLLVVEPKLPLIEGSPNQLQQVFLNVINNAAQAIASTGRGGTVVVRARPWLDGIAVDVVDDGPGIPDELLERIFEPFFSTKPEGEGTGLGLSICQGIVREHGGRLTVRSTRGHGATFTIELPSGRAAEPAAAPVAPGAQPRGRVLVVDDEPHILYYMRATLESWGHTVDTATDGSDALARLEAGGYDVIITDVRMPNLGGRELYERLRRDLPAMADRVVFATGDTVRDDTLAFLEQSGRPFLHKPFKLADLRSTLSVALEQRR